MADETRRGLPPVLFLYFEESLARAYGAILAEEGYAVSTAHTAEQALAYLGAHAGKRLVLLDNLHVFAEGHAFLDWLRRNPSVRAQVKVVCMAGFADVDAYAQAISQRYGDAVDIYLQLPVEVAELLHALKSL